MATEKSKTAPKAAPQKTAEKAPVNGPTSANENAPLSGDVLFYKNPQPLSKEAHGTLGVSPAAKPFAFAATGHAIPIVVGEFGPVSLNYPIIFAGGEHQPLAITSIRMNENLFIDENGQFPQGVYIPAFVRRYPFVFAQDADKSQMIICIDRDADIVTENGQIPLFENGDLSAYTRQCMDYCGNFETERLKTDAFLKVLRDLDLFEIREVNFTPTNPDGSQGETVKISEHFSPSPERIKALPDATQLELLKSGAMQQIHLHWNSLTLWERLIMETLRRYPGDPAPEAAA